MITIIILTLLIFLLLFSFIYNSIDKLIIEEKQKTLKIFECFRVRNSETK